MNDYLVAPGAGKGEVLATYLAALAGAGLAVGLAARAGLADYAVLVIAVVALDMFGGAVANATPAAKRRFHGPGRDWRHHLGFVVVHMQPFVLALVVPGFGWASAAIVYGLVVAASIVVLGAPVRLRRPAAFAVTALGIAVVTTTVSVPGPLAWFGPVLMVKLVLGHLLSGEATR